MPNAIALRVLARHLGHVGAPSGDTPAPSLDVIVADVGVFTARDVTEDAMSSPSANAKSTGKIARRRDGGADRDVPRRQQECELEAQIVQCGIERRLLEIDRLRRDLAEVGREVIALVERLRALVE